LQRQRQGKARQTTTVIRIKSGKGSPSEVERLVRSGCLLAPRDLSRRTQQGKSQGEYLCIVTKREKLKNPPTPTVCLKSEERISPSESFDPRSGLKRREAGKKEKRKLLMDSVQKRKEWGEK